MKLYYDYKSIVDDLRHNKYYNKKNSRFDHINKGDSNKGDSNKGDGNKGDNKNDENWNRNCRTSRDKKDRQYR